MKKILKFPKDFLFGAGVSAYQVEGGIENSDWSKDFPAGKACDHYNLYERDFTLLQELNLNAFRFSIEWSRIEPEQGKFNEKEIQYYRNYLQSLKNHGIKTMVTLHHFTSPIWLANIGGWSNKKSVFYFSRFAQKMLEQYGDLVDFWITMNEPLNYASIGYLEGRWPPQKRNPYLFLRVLKNQISAHKKVYQIFHKIKPDVKIGIAKINNLFEPYNSKSFLDKFSTRIIKFFWNEFFLNKIHPVKSRSAGISQGAKLFNGVKNHLDFIGLNYYFHSKIKFPAKVENKGGLISDLGWTIYPKGIYYVLMDLKKYNLPIYITENGVADKHDKLRKDFIQKHLGWIYKAIFENIDVRGYFHWSLIDNFEWEKGFEPRFGLIEIDYKTMQRKIRPSAYFYAKIVQNLFEVRR